jgi:hypothetical protein
VSDQEFDGAIHETTGESASRSLSIDLQVGKTAHGWTRGRVAIFAQKFNSEAWGPPRLEFPEHSLLSEWPMIVSMVARLMRAWADRGWRPQ